MAGFALAKHAFRGNRLLLMIFVAGNLVPFQVLMIPVRDLVIALGIYDSRWALILFHTAFQTGFCTLFMRNFIRELPDPLLDAARVEGAGELRGVLARRPAAHPSGDRRRSRCSSSRSSGTTTSGRWCWCSRTAIRPVTAGLQSLRGMWQTSWQLVAAASLLAALPPVVVFFVMQRHLVAGLTSGTRS